MKIPDKIKIAGHIYKVMWDDVGLSNRGLVGETDHNKHTISLCKYYRSKYPSAKSEIEETLIHEILHVIDSNYNNHALSEDEVARLAVGLYQVLVDNFKL